MVYDVHPHPSLTYCIYLGNNKSVDTLSPAVTNTNTKEKKGSIMRFFLKGLKKKAPPPHHSAATASARSMSTSKSVQQPASGTIRLKQIPTFGTLGSMSNNGMSSMSSICVFVSRVHVCVRV